MTQSYTLSRGAGPDKLVWLQFFNTQVRRRAACLHVLLLSVSPAKALHVSGVLEMSSSEPMESECSAEGLLRGGKGEISVSLASWARVSRRRRRFRLLVGVVRERRDTAFFIAGLSDWVTTQEYGANVNFLQSLENATVNAFIITQYSMFDIQHSSVQYMQKRNKKSSSCILQNY